MVKFVARAVETNMWDNCENDRIVLDTDDVKIAVEDSYNNQTHLVIGGNKDHYVLIDLTFDAYSAIACAGFEHVTTAAQIAS